MTIYTTFSHPTVVWLSRLPTVHQLCIGLRKWPSRSSLFVRFFFYLVASVCSRKLWTRLKKRANFRQEIRVIATIRTRLWNYYAGSCKSRDAPRHRFTLVQPEIRIVATREREVQTFSKSYRSKDIASIRTPRILQTMIWLTNKL